ncbi:hypothetical protein IAS59_005803 [Cryptococcus gattii]
MKENLTSFGAYWAFIPVREEIWEMSGFWVAGSGPAAGGVAGGVAFGFRQRTLHAPTAVQPLCFVKK